MTDLNKIPEQERINLTLIYEQYLAAKKQYPPFKSPHEAYAIILEELEETWNEIKNHKKPTHLMQGKLMDDSLSKGAGRDTMKYEIKSVGAMVLRFMLDL